MAPGTLGFRMYDLLMVAMINILFTIALVIKPMLNMRAGARTCAGLFCKRNERQVAPQKKDPALITVS